MEGERIKRTREGKTEKATENTFFAFAQRNKPMLETLTPHIRVLDQVPATLFLIQLPANSLGRQP